MKNAVMIILVRDDKYLLGKRSPWKEKAPGFWCPISGHVEPGESEEEAVRREAREEIGVCVEVIRKLTSLPTHDQKVMLHWWLVQLIEGEPRINNDENSELGWFTKKELGLLEPVFKEDIEILLKSGVASE
jgi:8-oxo-dGTP pyrophosphatase MutT (NUDIX family)